MAGGASEAGDREASVKYLQAAESHPPEGEPEHGVDRAGDVGLAASGGGGGGGGDDVTTEQQR